MASAAVAHASMGAPADGAPRRQLPPPPHAQCSAPPAAQIGSPDVMDSTTSSLPTLPSSFSLTRCFGRWHCDVRRRLRDSERSALLSVRRNSLMNQKAAKTCAKTTTGTQRRRMAVECACGMLLLLLAQLAPVLGTQAR
jgi:hypothetical protein